MKLISKLCGKKETEQELKIIDEKTKLLSEIKECREQIRINENMFNFHADYDMVDYCIYERESLFAKHLYLLNRLKAYDDKEITVKLALMSE